LPEKLLKSVFSFSSMTLISRIAGLARDIVFANYFGAKAATDAFFVAFKIPNFLRRLFAEGAFSQAFVPVLSETKTKQGEQAVRDLVAHTTGTLGVVLLVVSLLGVIGAPVVISIFGAGFLAEGNEDKFALSVEMLRFTFPYILFISLAALASGVLNTYRQFAIPAFTPVFLNLVLIIAAIGVSPYLDEPVMALAGGVFVAGIVQLGFQLPAVARLGLLPRPRWGWYHPGVSKIRKLMLPAIFGSSVVQISLLIDTLIASFLVTGSVTWIYFSDRLVEFPLGVFGVALSTVILPGLSSRHASDSPKQFFELMDWAMRWAVLVSIPAMVGLFVLAGPMLTTLFGYGEFSLRDVQMSRLSLMAYTLGLPAFIFIKVLAPGFFARQDTKTPVKAAIYAMLANIVLKFLLVGGLIWWSFDGVHMGLALATAIAAYVNCGLLYRWLKSGGVYSFSTGWGMYITRVFMASLIMGALLYGLSADTLHWYNNDLWYRVRWLLLWVVSGAAIFALALFSLGVRPVQLARPAQHN
jgi:putative peptidoglycan lipid II flippase